MPKKDPRVDAYIKKARPFAQPIMKHIRAVIHSASPDIVETMKWSSPSYEYQGMLCGFATFKEHIRFGFWKHTLVVGDGGSGGMGGFGHIKTLKDLPPKTKLVAYIKKAMELNAAGVKAPHMEARKTRPPLPVPADLKKALAKNARARAAFDAFPPSHRREYIEWITEAKTAPTRERRLATTIEWVAEGKGRNWKYQQK